MYARVLRKCSLAKFLMNLWLVLIMLLVICCHNATTMHLVKNTRPSRVSEASPMVQSADRMTGSLNLGNTMTIYHPFDQYMNPYYLRPPQGASYVQLNPDLSTFRMGETTQPQRLIRPRDQLQYYSPYTVIIKTNADRAQLSNPVPNINSQIINLNRNNYTSSSIYDTKDLLLNSVPEQVRKLDRESQSNQNEQPLERRRLVNSAKFSYPFRNSESELHSLQKKDETLGRIQSEETNVQEKHVNSPLFPVSPLKPSAQYQSQSPMFDHFRPPSDLQAEKDRRLRINRHRKRRHRHFEQTVPTDQNSDSQNLDHKNSNKSSSFSTITTTFSNNNNIKDNSTDSPSSKNYDPRLDRGARNDTRPIINSQNQQKIGSRLPYNRYLRRRLSRSHHPRRRPKRYCSARDPIQLAYLAPIVLEGKVRSMSPNRRANFSVSFEVTQIFKNRQNHNIGKLDLVRLQFTFLNTTGECDIYQELFRERGLIRRDLQNGRNYTLFLKYDGEKFRILGQPILSNQRVYNYVKNASQEKFGKTASIKTLTANRQGKVREKEDLRIVCKVRGNPPPKITWFKDDKSIKQNRQLYQFINLKRRSELIVKSFSNATAGLYECRAKNMVSKKVEKKTIRVEAYGRPDSHNDTGVACGTSMKPYCLNGGTCRFFSDINQYYCKCAEGFDGERCQEKRPTNVSLNQTVTGYMADSPTDTMSDESDENFSLSDESG